MKNIILIILLSLSFYACQKELPNYNFHEPTLREIKGSVFDFDTQKPMKDVKFYLIFNQSNVVDSVFSDANGRFKSTFYSFDFWDHQLEVVLPINYRNANNKEKFRFTGNENIFLKK